MVSSNQTSTTEEGIVVPFDQINPDTLKKMIEEFVTREWSSLSDDDYSLCDKVEQVLEQLKAGKVRVVFDLATESANLVAVR